LPNCAFFSRSAIPAAEPSADECRAYLKTVRERQIRQRRVLALENRVSCTIITRGSMKRTLVVAALLLCAAVPAAAQTEGRVSVGASITWVNPTDSEIRSLLGWGPLIRLNPKEGWGVAAALSWFLADIDHPTDPGAGFVNMRVRPLMAGVAYTAGKQPALVSFSIVAGPSFNKLEFDDDFLRSLPPGSIQPQLDADTSFAVRPGIGVTWTLAPRIAAVGFGGYMINRPDVFYRSPTGQEFRNRWKADAVLLSVGLVYSLF
jgi:hypothetical protein